MKIFVLFSAAVGMLLLPANGSVAGTITFTGGSLGDGASLANTYTQTVDGDLYTLAVSAGGAANINATSPPFVSSFLTFTQPATITLTGPPAFNLSSLNFASTAIAINLSVLGNLVGGGTLNQSLATTSAGASLDSFNFAGWINLSSVVFSSTSGGATIGLDDVVVSAFSPPAAVPEPATASIIGLGTLVGAFCQYRRRKLVDAK